MAALFIALVVLVILLPVVVVDGRHPSRIQFIHPINFERLVLYLYENLD